MIKPIQLRGISRNPSDRMTSDGGCAESLNVHLDENEIAPTLKPEDVTGMLDSEGNRMFPELNFQNQWECVFIHKSPNYKKAILLVTIAGRIIIGWMKNNEFSAILDITSYGEFIRCISLGNTLGIVAEHKTTWVIFKDGDYLPLGADVPFPAFSFINKEVNDSSVTRTFNAYSDSHSVNRTYMTTSAQDARSQYFSFEGWGPTFNLPDVWNEITEKIGDNRAVGVMNYQRFAVLAIKLYDNTRLMSAPVIISPGFQNPFNISYSEVHNVTAEQAQDQTLPGTWYRVTGTVTTNVNVKFATAYKLVLKLNEQESFFDDWHEIVDGIEVYLSAPVGENIKKNQFSDTGMHYSESGNSRTYSSIINLGEQEYDYEREYLEKSVFNLVAYYPLNTANMMELIGGKIVDIGDAIYPDNWSEKDRLPITSDMKHYTTLYQRAITYNNSIVASDISEQVAFDSSNLGLAMHYMDTSLVGVSDVYQTPNPTLDSGKQLRCRITFHLRDEVGREFSVLAAHNGNSTIDYGQYGPLSIIGSTRHFRQFYAWLICPDTRAYAATIETSIVPIGTEEGQMGNNITTKRVQLVQHPYLPCKYYYGIMARPITQVGESAEALPELAPSSHVDVVPNKVYVSKMDNPLVFPIENRFTFSGKVMGCAVATAALSEGQFGQFPLYVFTDSGIWSMEVSSDGTFHTPKPGPMDVCVNAESITPVDNGVIFVTDKALMLLVGSQVTDLSRVMIGKPFEFKDNNSTCNLLSEDDNWNGLLPSVVDNVSFIDYIKGAHIMYDYLGNRIIIMNYSKPYQFVYMLTSQTWHKISNMGHWYPYRIVNNYPDSYVNARTNQLGVAEVNRILNYSVKEILHPQNTSLASYVLYDFGFNEAKTIGETNKQKILKAFSVLRILFGSDNNRYAYIQEFLQKVDSGNNVQEGFRLDFTEKLFFDAWISQCELTNDCNVESGVDYGDDYWRITDFGDLRIQSNDSLFILKEALVAAGYYEDESSAESAIRDAFNETGAFTLYFAPGDSITIDGWTDGYLYDAERAHNQDINYYASTETSHLPNKYWWKIYSIGPVFDPEEEENRRQIIEDALSIASLTADTSVLPIKLFFESVDELDDWLDALAEALLGSEYQTTWDSLVKTEINSIVVDKNNIKGMIITRAFDLDAHDVRKTLRSVRIRGNFERRDVQYILLGSFDGIHWQRMTSLRGGSYKLFRMVLLTNLAPGERISWVDIDYEPRYANKLR